MEEKIIFQPDAPIHQTPASAGHNDTYLAGGDAYFAALQRHIGRAEASHH